MVFGVDDHWFFLSYARRDAIGEKYVQRFRRDLALAVGRVGALASQLDVGDIGFLDTEGIEPGDRWPETLARALESSRVLVSLYSGAYFNSDYCGREFSAFQTIAGADFENRFIPVLWAPAGRLPAPLPPPVAHIQHSVGALPPYITEGMYGLISRSRHRDAYRETIDHLAELIVRRAAVVPTGTPTAPLPRLDQVSSAFEPRPTLAATSASARHRAGPATAAFAFATEPGRDWRPFAPDDITSVGLIAQHAATTAAMFFETLAMGAALIEQIREAERANTVVLLVVDPISAQLPAFRQLLDEFDAAAFVNCAALVTWGTTATPREQELLRTVVRPALSRRVVDGIGLRLAIRSAVELHDEIVDAIAAVRRRMLQHAEVFIDLPDGPMVPVPAISGTTRVPA